MDLRRDFLTDPVINHSKFLRFYKSLQQFNNMKNTLFKCFCAVHLYYSELIKHMSQKLYFYIFFLFQFQNQQIKNMPVLAFKNACSCDDYQDRIFLLFHKIERTICSLNITDQFKQFCLIRKKSNSSHEEQTTVSHT